MNKIIGINILGLILLFSCEAENIIKDKREYRENDKPEIPSARELNMNGDTLVDFTIEYGEGVADGVDTFYYFITGGIHPEGTNEILRQENYNLLFSKAGDTIFREYSDKIWEGQFSSLISITSDFSYWNNEWRIGHNDTEANNFLVFKINNITPSLIGWMNINLNPQTGEIDIIDFNSSHQSTMIVGQ
ncbi:hypothetical protein [Membranihabitans maritimus]|uniref:hypothetical protein n=1 Tax=Membranihabitans maritimus TaxID=2904244 RepID=UPI001F336C5E|nr:hypothetical protein [Membranihabitans maritimus]